ncbi:beta-galactosidase [Microcella flavibacter]|uniref:beta-galactosidase n=1 Tax=Microcella flavibacter TaxID=1804990 RepID=UPI001E4F8015|nr:beta-galactosidase [Microcella flavibacter]
MTQRRDAALTIRASAPVLSLPTPLMSHGDDRHDRVALGPGRVERDGRPWIPVSGELHPTRVPRRHWRERLQLLRSGGVSVVSSYVIWIHHQPEPGPARFDGQRDVAAFVALAAEVGLDVVLRVGPWVHGEVRNGGLPDWVQAADVRHRTDDPAYLARVEEWFAALGAHLAGVCGPSSPVIAVQLENELIDQPGHLVMLAAMAR